jgi:SAM-dependent methyltransferase
LQVNTEVNTEMTSAPFSPDPMKEHWETVYGSRAPTELSWYQSRPAQSLALLDELGVASSAIIDVGGGASTLVDALLDRGARDITVLDISRAALEHAKARLGARADSVEWIEGDITRIDLGAAACYDIWHDRAVFHFLTDPDDRRRYVAAASQALRPGGAALIATFAPQGPPRCSGLDVMRYDPEQLAHELGSEFSLERSAEELHRTPSGAEQAFSYTVLRRH